MPDVPFSTNTELIQMQTPPSALQPGVTKTDTDLLIPSRRAADRLRHFPDNVYDVSAESHISRFMKAILGDSGVGWWNKRLTIQRMRATLQGSHFYDLDRFYGALFGLKRAADEVLSINPYAGTALRDQWDDTFARDASFRSRIEQFSQAILFGSTPVGMELIAEALLSVDVEINEVWTQADTGFQTYTEIEADYGAYSTLEGVNYDVLEGFGTEQLAGNERRVFIVRPKRPITLAESYDLTRVLNKLKPADTRFEIDTSGIPLYDPVAIRTAHADSEHWEVLNKIVPLTPAVNLPYPIQTVDPSEQPKPPFTGYQGEAWSYVQDLAGVAASQQPVDEPASVSPPQRAVYSDGSMMQFSAAQAVLPARLVQAGRQASDAVMVSYAYDGQPGLTSLVIENRADALTKLYVDGVPLDELNVIMSTLSQTDPFQQNPENRYWVTPPRYQEDATEDIIEFRLKSDQWVNYITFEMVRYPHRVIVEAYDSDGGVWNPLFTKEHRGSVPRLLNPGTEIALRAGHPQHAFPGHWERISQRVPPNFTRRVRFRLIRGPGEGPMEPRHTTQFGQNVPAVPVAYTLAIRSTDIGYRVSSRSDFSFIEGPVIGQTVDAIGSQMQFEVSEQIAERALDDSEVTAWRSEPQPINYSVVNFYLDVRGDQEDGQVIDRFYVNPTHAGPNLTIYHSDDPRPFEDTTEFFETCDWVPIPRNYTLHKGYIHIPQTRARYFKFEFSNLVPEVYENFIPITRRIKLFPQAIRNEAIQGYSIADEALLPGMKTNLTTAEELHFQDAILGSIQNPPRFVGQEEYRPTESLWVHHTDEAARAKNDSFQYGFIPWHQSESQYPRFTRTGRHEYENVQYTHDTKVAFFVGLRDIKAYRTMYEQSENTVVYWDTFEDFRNLTQPFDWAFDPGYLISEGTLPPVTAESRIFHSLDNVKAVQFATEQSDPLQLIPDDTFRDPSLALYDWSDPDRHLRVGDAQLIYDPADFSVINLRYTQPPPKPVDRVSGIVQPIPNPVFEAVDYEVADDEAESATKGGVRTPTVALSEAGRVHAAVRFTMTSAQSSPLILRVHDYADDSIIVEREFPAQQGETVEGDVGFDIPTAATAVYMEFIQEGKSNDTWKLFALSLFDDGMMWEFSNNGGENWYPAIDIRNNQNGILSFPRLGNQLRYRVTAYRTNRWVSAVKLRPHYAGVGNARPTGTQHGPNVSVYDQDVPINLDPMFTQWTKPIPYHWYAASRRFPLLQVEGAAVFGEFASFFARPVDDDISYSGAPLVPVRPTIANTLVQGWDANELTLSDGVDVTSWLDVTGNYTATPLGGAAPSFDGSASPLGNLPGVRFAGLERLGVTGGVLSTTTYFMVVQNPINDGGRKHLIYSNGYLYFVKWETANRWIFGTSQFSFFEFTDASIIGQHCLWTYVHKGPGSFIRANQELKASGHGGGPATTTAFWMGGEAANSDFIMHEVLAYNGEVSAGDIDIIEDYLHAKWFQPWTLGPGSMDSATGVRVMVRQSEDRLDLVSPTLDVARSEDTLFRETTDNASSTEQANAFKVIGESDPLNAPVPDDV